MQAIRHALIGLACATLMSSSALAEEISHEQQLVHVNLGQGPTPSQSTQRVTLQTFDPAMGELTKVNVFLVYRTESNLGVLNPTSSPVRVDGEVSERIDVMRLDGVVLLSQADEQAHLGDDFMPGERRRLRNAHVGNKRFTMYSGFEDWTRAAGESIDLDVAFDFTLDTLSDGNALVEYRAGARATVKVVYEYTPAGPQP